MNTSKSPSACATRADKYQAQADKFYEKAAALSGVEADLAFIDAGAFQAKANRIAAEFAYLMLLAARRSELLHPDVVKSQSLIDQYAEWESTVEEYGLAVTA